MNCPICNKEILFTDSFCHTCGFEIHILPNEISANVEAYEQKRIDKHKALYESLQKVDELSVQIETKEKELAEKTQLCDSLQEEVVKQKETIAHTASEKPLAFLVMTQENSVSSIFGIYEGDNSFGYTKSHDRHQQIICNAQVADVHFSIKADISTDSKGRNRTKYYVTPREGHIYGSAEEANIISNEKELEKNESIFIDNVRFTLVANKK